jgi:hypothetical protein
MKGLFSRLGATAAKPRAEKTQPQDDELQKMLTRAGEVVNQLKASTQENFPLLNEATRLGNGRLHSRYTKRDAWVLLKHQAPGALA